MNKCNTSNNMKYAQSQGSEMKITFATLLVKKKQNKTRDNKHPTDDGI